MHQTTEWIADLYYRISVADGDKVESNSISNQRDLIHYFLKSHPEIKIHKERPDDGYSGVNFDRPHFKDMLADIRAGKVNCVIVKDLSRFGRNYIEMGKYLQQIFPFMGVRFIAINDNYDSLYSDPSTDNLIVPLKNLINDSYCRDTSIKIRSHLDVKRRNGECVSAFTVYGYKKDPENKHRLIIDEPAAIVVRDIFNKKIEGLSLSAIAKCLNDEGIPSPLEYRKMRGNETPCGFRVYNRTLWSAVAVRRIIQNAVYTGRLEQGKTMRPNYKVKKAIDKDKSDWICVENAHDAIVSAEDYRIANDMILADTRMAPGSKKVYMLSGLLYCGDCKQGMIHRVVESGGKKYNYYYCSTYHINSKDCTIHNISEPALLKIVEHTVKTHIRAIVNVKRMLDYIERLPHVSFEVAKLDEQLAELEKDLRQNEAFKTSAFEKYIDGTITEAMYREYTAIYDRKCADLRIAIERRQQAINDMVARKTPKCEWMNYFIEHRNIEHLDRVLLVRLVERIYVYQDKRIEFVFRYRSEYEELLEYIADAEEMADFKSESIIKEAV